MSATPSTAVQNVSPQQQVMNHVVSTFTKNKHTLAAALPRHFTVDRFLRLTQTALRTNPRLLECEPSSIIGAVVMAAQLGLEPGTPIGESYLIPRRLKGVLTCTMLPGYRGLMKLARNSGQIVSINADVVYDADHFVYEKGTDRKIVHKPSEKVERGDLKACYCIVVLKGGGMQFEVMSKAEIEAIKARVKAQNGGKLDGPWITDEAEMWRKTVTRRTLKYCPASIEYQNAIAYEDAGPSALPSVEMDLSDLAQGFIPVGGSTSLDAVTAQLAPAADPGAEAADPGYDTQTGEVHDPPAARKTRPKAPSPVPTTQEVEPSNLLAAAEYAGLLVDTASGPQIEVPDGMETGDPMYGPGTYPAAVMARNQDVARFYYDRVRMMKPVA